jgi:hypothetical protein
MTHKIDVGLITYGDMLPLSDDDEPLLYALREKGLCVEPFVWDDPTVEWASVRLSVIRSPWDYHLRRDEFLAWADRASLLTDLWNRLHTVRWNSNKSYLRDLSSRGIPIIPTVWLSQGEEVDLPRVLDERGWTEVVVKPVVSLDAYGTMRVNPSNVGEGQSHLARFLRERDMMVQPYMDSVEGYGERSLVYIDGALSHAVRRTPVLSGEKLPAALVDATLEELRLADSVLRAADHETLYARVDMVRDNDGTLRLMELELVEPSLFFMQAPSAVERMVYAIHRRLG